MPFLSAVEPRQVRSSSALWFVVDRDKILLRKVGERFALLGQEDRERLALDPACAHYLGTLDDTDVFATEQTTPPPEGYELTGLRSVFAMLGEEAFFAGGRAVQVIEWATTHRFCGRCATPTARLPNERCMSCPKCGHQAYPRIAPAVIVLVRKGEEALLARGARFPAAFFSTLAGFSEVGESLEETLHREIREEVGIEVTNPRYFGSQPWPFPHSLMIGFFAEWKSGEIRIDQREILDAKWCRADALPTIPPKLSIARRLIDAWVEDVLGRPINGGRP
jgi:NAD+ diphosphatase